jgi:hypothetical protein
MASGAKSVKSMKVINEENKISRDLTKPSGGVNLLKS